jgi:hypothetical protein
MVERHSAILLSYTSEKWDLMTWIEFIWRTIEASCEHDNCYLDPIEDGEILTL